MINLLPIDNRKQLRASIHNVTLRRFAFFFVGTLIVLTSSIFVIYFSITQTKSDLENQLQQVNQRAMVFAKTKQSADKLRSDLSNAHQIIKQQAQYSKLLIAIAQHLPHNIKISGLSLDDKSLKQQLVQILSPNNDLVITTKQNLEKASFISKVDIQSVARDQKNGTVTAMFLITFDQTKLKETVQWQN